MTAGLLLSPLPCYALAAAGFGLCLYLFATLKREIAGLQRARREGRLRVEQLEAALGEARQALQSLAADVREVEQQTGMLVAPAPARSGLNLSKRTQVLRMHRHGQDSAGIAASLSLPRAEVDLLLKVQRLVLQQS